MAETALFVIDIQAELVSIPDTAIPHAARIREAGERILTKARTQTSPKPLIVIVQHSEDPGSPNATLIAGSPAWELAFPPQGNEGDEMLVGKTTRDTFDSNPDLAARLKAQGVKRIVAFGIQSDFCVGATCRGAVSAGFEVVLLQGAHSTYDDKKSGRSALDIEREVEGELEAIGVRVVPWEGFEF
ncbi:cysteine hydrolase family protein [Aspergillus lucknowensis]|uniref:Isochorismatase-like protein n=1 Tax=Aspergillus lucknowensis TaxID=176173 RepID=A0ABR4M561_9EURO